MQKQCKQFNLGLLIFLPGLELITVVETIIDEPKIIHDLPEELGFFPEALLSKLDNIDDLIFKDIISIFLSNIRTIQKSDSDIESKSRELVLDTVNTLLSSHPSFKNQMGRFMRLENFEKLLRIAEPDSSDHIFHSFRVFLAGCPIINKFIKYFKDAHKYYTIGRKVKIEYSWLLTAIFHDIGRPKEKIPSFTEEQYNDEYVSIKIVGKEDRWKNQDYQKTISLLDSFAQAIGSDEQIEWDGGSITDDNSKEFQVDLIALYDSFKSHAIISAIDFLYDICKKAKAADERKYRPFVLSHAVPAALAILLHDWRIHDQAKKWKLFPISIKRFPLAALLAFIDTWDDYKRHNSDMNMCIKKFDISDNTVNIEVVWGDSSLYEKEVTKYKAFKKYYRDKVFNMKISHKVLS